MPGCTGAGSPATPDDANIRRSYSSRSSSGSITSSAPSGMRHATPPTAEREVRVRLNVYNLTEISLPEHTFTVDFFCEVSWEDEDLTNGEELQDLDESAWESMFPYISTSSLLHWSPRLIFSNLKSLGDKKSWCKLYTMREDGINPLPYPVVCYSLLGTRGTFFERFELDSFPYDAQDLQIVIQSLHNLKRKQTPDRRRSTGILRSSAVNSAAPESSDLGPWWTVNVSSDERAQCFGTPGKYGPPGAPHLVKNEGEKYKPVVPYDTFVLQDEYILVNGVFALEKLSDVRWSGERKRYPRLILSLKIVRRAEVYIHNIFIPTFLFVVLGFLSFAFRPEDLSDRLSLVSSLLLTAVTYQQYVAEQLPKTTDTALHRHVQIAIFVLFAIGIEAVAMNKVYEWLRTPNSSGTVTAAAANRAKLLGIYEDYLGVFVLVLWFMANFKYTSKASGRGTMPKTQLQVEVEAEIALIKRVLAMTCDGADDAVQEGRYRQTLDVYEKWVREINEAQRITENPVASVDAQERRSDARAPLAYIRSDSLGSTFDTDSIYRTVMSEERQKALRSAAILKRTRLLFVVVSVVMGSIFVGGAGIMRQRDETRARVLEEL